MTIGPEQEPRRYGASLSVTSHAVRPRRKLEKAGSIEVRPKDFVEEVEVVSSLPSEPAFSGPPPTGDAAITPDLTGLGTALNKIKELADRGVWRPTRPSPLELNLRSVDNHSTVSFEAVAAFVNYVNVHLGIQLELNGGGFGCFDMGFAARQDRGAALDDAIVNDPNLQRLLNDLNINTAQIRSQNATRSYSAFYEVNIALATNRNKLSGKFDRITGVSELFGGASSHEMRYGLAEVLVPDLSRGQPKQSLMKRVWRRASLGVSRLREQSNKVLVQRVNLMDLTEFNQLLTAFTGRGAVVIIHGYANSFDDAISACALGAYRTKLEQLQLLPMIFSWPSRGSSLSYLPDLGAAENSEYPLYDLLQTVASAAIGREVNVLAHSHGNKLLVRALCSDKRTSTSGTANRLTRLILVEPDIEQEFLQQRATSLAEVSEQIIIYHSENDRALALASFLFDSIRAGRHGLTLNNDEAGPINEIEVIDASRVARGLSKHAPHLESPEVISDIYHLLHGMKPNDRFHLRPSHVHAGHWEMVPAET